MMDLTEVVVGAGQLTNKRFSLVKNFLSVQQSPHLLFAHLKEGKDRVFGLYMPPKPAENSFH
ncbi:hypothetical protein Hanom_Chr10g00962181 [Helianthus anomalus]